MSVPETEEVRIVAKGPVYRFVKQLAQMERGDKIFVFRIEEDALDILIDHLENHLLEQLILMKHVMKTRGVSTITKQLIQSVRQLIGGLNFFST